MIISAFDHTALKNWFSEEKRSFPWREDPSPYGVWISEVMLQQTRASVVVGYFLRWMERFPTIPALAAASLDDVIKAWEGLGYYSRARNLHSAAKQLVTHFDGILPSDETALEQIQGLGPYTVGAIRSFAFHQRAAAVDGNVIRVLTRYFAITEDIAKISTQKMVRRLALELLPEEEPWQVAEALIELGATLCGKSPQCSKCPLNKSCQAFLSATAASLPNKSAKQKIEALHRLVLIPCCDDMVGVQRGKQGRVMADLYEFPYVTWRAHEPAPNEAEAAAQLLWGASVTFLTSLPPQRHSFTRYRVQLFPAIVSLSSPLPALQWQHKSSLSALPFSAGHRRILQNLISSSAKKSTFISPTGLNIVKDQK